MCQTIIYIHIFNINEGLNIGYQNINQQSKTQLPNPEYDCFTCRTKYICRILSFSKTVTLKYKVHTYIYICNAWRINLSKIWKKTRLVSSTKKISKTNVTFLRFMKIQHINIEIGRYTLQTVQTLLKRTTNHSKSNARRF